MWCDKLRTICLAAFADGTKFKPFIVFKGKRIPKEICNVQNAVIRMSHNGWMNEDLTKEWIATVWNVSVQPSAKQMLVWDTFKCHFTSSVKSLLQQSNTDLTSVPPGCSCPVVAICTVCAPRTSMVELPGISAHTAVSSMFAMQLSGN